MEVKQSLHQELKAIHEIVVRAIPEVFHSRHDPMAYQNTAQWLENLRDYLDGLIKATPDKDVLSKDAIELAIKSGVCTNPTELMNLSRDIQQAMSRS